MRSAATQAMSDIVEDPEQARDAPFSHGNGKVVTAGFLGR